jgi:hypothetical protein
MLQPVDKFPCMDSCAPSKHESNDNDLNDAADDLCMYFVTL